MNTNGDNADEDTDYDILTFGHCLRLLLKELQPRRRARNDEDICSNFYDWHFGFTAPRPSFAQQKQKSSINCASYCLNYCEKCDPRRALRKDNCSISRQHQLK